MIPRRKFSHKSKRINKRFVQEEAEEKQEEDNQSEDEEKEEPLDLSWPDTCRARLFYIVLAPILFPLAWSTPDVRRVVSKFRSILQSHGFTRLKNL